MRFGALVLLSVCLIAVGALAFPFAQGPQNALPTSSNSVNPNDSTGDSRGFDVEDGTIVSSTTGGQTRSSKVDEIAVTESEVDDYEVISNDGITADHQGGVVVVQIAEGHSLDEVNAEIATIDCLAQQTLTEDDVSLGWVKLKLADGASVPDAMETLGCAVSIQGTQPNYVYTLDEVDSSDASAEKPDLQVGSIVTEPEPIETEFGGETHETDRYWDFVNDTEAWNQMVLMAVRAREAYLYTHNADTHVPTAWVEDADHKRPAVAILDTGCLLSHPDLQGNIIDDYDAVERKKTGKYIGSHGTHVAGIVAAETNNNEGITGVSFNAKIVSVKVFKQVDGMVYADSLDILAGYDYIINNAATDNIRVANMSLGATTEYTDNDDKALLEAVDEAYRAGILTTISAGNDADSMGGAYWDYPSDFAPNAIGVIDFGVTGVTEGYYDLNDNEHLFKTRIWLTRDTYSNFNLPNTMNKQISGLGSSVMSTVPLGYGDDYGRFKYYGRKNGTSMAAPCVAGVAALALSVNPDLTVDELKSLLYSSAVDVADQKDNPYNEKREENPELSALDPTIDGFDPFTGFGTVDAYNAVVAADTNTYISGSTLVAKGGSLTLSIPASAHATNVEWEPDDSGIASVESVTGATDSASSTATIRANKGGQVIIKATCTVPATPSTYGANVAEGATRQITLYAIVAVYDAPITGSTTVEYCKSISLGMNATPSNGTWKWSSDETNVATVSQWAGEKTETVTVTGKGIGTATITATLTSASDPAIEVAREITVTQHTLEPSEVSLGSTSYTYDGEAKRPAVTVTVNSTTLKEGTDYTVSYSNNTVQGTAWVTVTGKGGCKGTVKKSFTINRASIANAGVTLNQSTFAHDGTAKKPKVTVVLGRKTLIEGTDYTVSYQDNTAVGTGKVIVYGKGNYTGQTSRTFVINRNAAYDNSISHSVKYRTHVQNVGWQGYVRDGAVSGTSGRSLRLEGINLSLAAHPYSGSIRYRTHIQDIGWEGGWKYDGAMSGTSGRSLRLEAIQIELTGQMAAHYDVYYRVHCQNIGWMGWARNGARAGTAGHSYRLEAIQIKLVPKGGAAPGSTSGAFRDGAGAQSGVPDSESYVLYRTHVQDDGWQNYMRDGEVAGTSGRSLRLEGINIKLGGNASGGIQYRTHVQNIGWQGWRSNGAMAGTSGQSLRLEAIEIELTGAAKQKYDVYYRVHCQNIGWMGWAKNGARAGTAGYSYRLEAIQVKLVPKNSAAPGSTANAFRSR